MNDNVICSMQNAKVKRLLLLQQKAAGRRRAGLFVVEGQRETARCIKAGFEIDSAFVCPQHFTGDEVLTPVLSALEERNRLFVVSPEVYERMAYRGSTEGIVVEVRCRDTRLDELTLNEDALVVVLEGVEKPGNVGAVLRSADAAGVDAVIVCDPRTDLYNPNLIRSSVGGFFSVPCVACSTEVCIDFLKTRNIQILTAQLQDSHRYYDTDMKRATALVMGTEATGLTDSWRKAADAHIRIPMLGSVDSLNVSVSAAILMYEAVRQRQAPQSGTILQTR